MRDPEEGAKARYGLMTEKDIRHRVEEAFAGSDPELLELMHLFALSPNRMDYLVLRLGLDSPVNLTAQLAAVRRYRDEKGEEPLLMRLRREQWKALQEHTDASTTAREILDSVDRGKTPGEPGTSAS